MAALNIIQKCTYTNYLLSLQLSTYYDDDDDDDDDYTVYKVNGEESSRVQDDSYNLLWIILLKVITVFLILTAVPFRSTSNPEFPFFLLSFPLSQYTYILLVLSLCFWVSGYYGSGSGLGPSPDSLRCHCPCFRPRRRRHRHSRQLQLFNSYSLYPYTLSPMYNTFLPFSRGIPKYLLYVRIMETRPVFVFGFGSEL